MYVFVISSSSDASSSVGALTSCEAAQMEAYYNLATASSYGALNTWDTATVAAVGTMIGQYLTDQCQSFQTLWGITVA